MGAAQRVQCVYAARSGAQGRQVVSWSGPGPHISANTRVVWSGLSRGVVYTVQLSRPRRRVRSCARWVACVAPFPLICNCIGHDSEVVILQVCLDKEQEATVQPSGARRSCEHPIANVSTPRYYTTVLDPVCHLVLRLVLDAILLEPLDDLAANHMRWNQLDAFQRFPSLWASHWYRLVTFRHLLDPSLD